jgi:hypothetical protein
MRCGWGCGAQLTGRDMRAHFTECDRISRYVRSGQELESCEGGLLPKGCEALRDIGPDNGRR